MFWSVVLPFKITLCVLAVVLALVTGVAGKFNWKRSKAFGITLLIGAMALVPSCTGIMKLMDPYRFGVFEYETGADVTDVHVSRWLPVAAKSVIVEHQSNGFRASFTISQKELDEYFDDQWNRYGEYSVSTRSERESGRKVQRSVLEHEFGGLDWQMFDDAEEYQGPIASNGAGYSIWYSPSQAIGYQSAGYW